MRVSPRREREKRDAWFRLETKKANVPRGKTQHIHTRGNALTNNLPFSFSFDCVVCALDLLAFPWSQVFPGKSILIEKRSLHLTPAEEAPIHRHIGFDRALLPLKRYKSPHPLLLWERIVNNLLARKRKVGVLVRRHKVIFLLIMNSS